MRGRRLSRRLRVIVLLAVALAALSVVPAGAAARHHRAGRGSAVSAVTKASGKHVRAHRRARRGAAAVSPATSAVASPGVASPGVASPGVGNAQYFPSISVAAASAAANPAACTTTCAKMTFHGGTVQHAELDYQIFWQPSGFYMPPSYKSGLGTWLAEVAGADYTPGNPFSVAQQYYDLTGPGATKSFTPYAVINGGQIIDSDPLPASGCTDGSLTSCVTQAQIQIEIQKVVVANHLPQNENTSYSLFTPLKVGSCSDGSNTDCAYSNYCAYHSFFNGTTGQFVYQNMPWSYGVSNCDVNDAFGVGYANGSALDPEVGTYSHELIETMTDPNLNGWYGANLSNEIGDKCAYIYGSGGYGSHTGLPNNGLGFWNLNIGGAEYLMQQQFSNANSNGSTTGCVINDTFAQPVVTITISPNPPVHGTSSTFTGHITDAAGVSKVLWTFGDGTTGTTNPINHTYATAGAKTLTLIVTDNNGQEKKVVQTVTVS